MRAIVVPALTALVLTSLHDPASAQPITWNLAPFCNAVVLTKASSVSDLLTGYDDQCGTGFPLPVVAQSASNADGTVELSMHTTLPSGIPLQIDARFNGVSLLGTWRDSQLNRGTFSPGPGGIGFKPRPTPTSVVPRSAVGAAQIVPTQVQRRVSGVCAAGQMMSAINENGSVACVPAGAGDITAVLSGPGLLGGAPSGDAIIGVNFGATGTATTVARSDHTHGFGTENTGVGTGALPPTAEGRENSAVGHMALSATVAGSAMFNTAVGAFALKNNIASDNTAVGSGALRTNDVGRNNTAVGSGALQARAGGVGNTAIGQMALRALRAGDRNTAIGGGAMSDATSGAAMATASDNIAVGHQSLQQVRNGDNNIAIGSGAGARLTTGNNNIYVQAKAAVGTESNTMRIGSDLDRVFIDGIRNVMTDDPDAVPVIIDVNGQLGTIPSSGRFKDDIAPLGAVSRDIFKLRPVQFTYKQPFANGSKPLQYGLIAEEVAAVMPALAARGADGEIETVKYHLLPTLLLAEVQRLEHERGAAEVHADTLKARVEALEQLVRQLVARVGTARTK